MQSDDSADQSQAIRQLRLRFRRKMTVASVLDKFLDQVNRGELVDKEELLQQVPYEMRAELVEELDFVVSMLFIDEVCRKERTRLVNQHCGGVEGSEEKTKMQIDEHTDADQIRRAEHILNTLDQTLDHVPTTEDVRKKRADQIRVVRQMLKDLKQTLGHFPAMEDVWMEFTFRVNRGELVDKEELIKQYLSQTRRRLARSLTDAEMMATLNRSYVPPSAAMDDGGRRGKTG